MHSNPPAPELIAQWTPWVVPAVIRRRRRRVRRWRWVFDGPPLTTGDGCDRCDDGEEEEPEPPADEPQSH